MSFEYWENRYKLKPKYFGKDWIKRIQKRANHINKFIKEHEIKKVLDYGCGDGRHSQYIMAENYLGIEISKTVIQKCRILNPGKIFYLAKENDRDLKDLLKRFKPELSLSFWVISHCIEDEIFEEYMDNLFCSEKFVIIHSFNEDKDFKNGYEKHRNFTKYIKKFKNWKLMKSVYAKFEYVYKHG